KHAPAGLLAHRRALLLRSGRCAGARARGLTLHRRRTKFDPSCHTARRAGEGREPFSNPLIARSDRMRLYHDIRLGDRSIETPEMHGEEIVRAGRYFIAKTLLDLGAATVDPMSPDNPLIFSAGPFAGTSFSNANRTSVGCKSPLTGGIKEANG